MNVLIHFLAFIITVLILISFHEAGHFLVAKWLGIKVLRFSIGFGKPLFRFRDKKDTEYIVAWLPLGGYVKLLDEREQLVSEKDLPLAFNQQPLWSRALVVIAGPVTNLIFAIVGFWVMFLIGVQVLRPVVGGVIPNSIAAYAGLRAGDEIIKVDGSPTPSLQKVLIAIVKRLGETSTMSVEAKDAVTKQNNIYHLDLRNWYVDPLNPSPLESMGIYVSPKAALLPNMLLMRQYTPLTALGFAFSETKELLTFNFIILKKMVLGQIALSSLGGPITIFQTANMAFRQGVSVFLGFLALVSVMLAFINLLPIPGLDGGHLLNFLIEFIIRRPLSIRYEMISVQVGIIVLMIILLFATLNDILRLIGHSPR